MPTRRVILLVAGLALAGCRGGKVRIDATQEPDRLGASRLQSDSLNSKMRMLNARMDELGQRNQGLTQEVGRLKFLNEQLRKQLGAVGDAPRQRQIYKSQVAKQQLLIERLEKRVEEMKKKLEAAGKHLDERLKPGPTSRPG